MTPNRPLVSHLTALVIGLFACVCSLPAQTPRTGSPIFREPKINLQDRVDNTAASSRPLLARPEKSPGTVDELEEKRDTLEREVQYAKTKLEASQKKLAVQSAVGNAEQIEKFSLEVKDWEARIKVSKDELEAVQQEIDKLRPAQPTMGESDVIVPGENLEIFVNEDPSFNGRYQVRRGGYIILAQVGRVMLAGKSVQQAEYAVKRALESSQLTRATVMLERIAGSDVETGPLIFCSGAFKNPRPYRIPNGTAPTLVSLMLSCGGATTSADLTRVKIMRMAGGKSVVEEVNLKRILEGGGLNSDVTLAEGDVVVIPGGPSKVVYITGNVKRQGVINFSETAHLSGYGAILKSGGLARFADEKGAYVLREMPDGTKRKIALNLVDIKKGKKPDVLLEVNDIIIVPEKWFSW